MSEFLNSETSSSLTPYYSYELAKPICSTSQYEYRKNSDPARHATHAPAWKIWELWLSYRSFSGHFRSNFWIFWVVPEAPKSCFLMFWRLRNIPWMILDIQKIIKFFMKNLKILIIFSTLSCNYKSSKSLVCGK